MTKAVLNKVEVESGQGCEWVLTDSLVTGRPCLGKLTPFQVDDGVSSTRRDENKRSVVFSSLPREIRVDWRPAVVVEVVVVVPVGMTAAASRQHWMGSSQLTILGHRLAAVVDPF